MDRLEAEVASIAGRLNAAHAELVAATARLIEDELWAGSGIMSPEHWLVLRAGLSPARARDITRIARRREQLPSTRAALDDGQLSVDQAAVVAKYAPTSHEASITELAVNATVPQLRRTLSRYQFGEVAPATAGRTRRLHRNPCSPGRRRGRRRRRSCRRATTRGGSS